MNAISTWLLIFISFGIFINCFQWLKNYLSLKKSLSTIPGPKNYVFFGNLLEMVKMRPDNYYIWLTDLSYKFKRDGIFVTWLSVIPTVTVTKPWHMEAILPSIKLIEKHPMYKVLKTWLGNGLLTSNGDEWRFQRRLTTPAFHFAILSEFFDIMVEKAEILNNCIKLEVEKKRNGPINIFDLATKCTLDTFCVTAMGIDDHMQTMESNDYVEAVRTFTKMSTERAFRPWLNTDFVYFLTSRGRECKKVLKVLHDFTTKVIQQRQAERARLSYDSLDEHDNKKSSKRKAFLDLLLDASEMSDVPLTNEQLREQVDTFMFGGHDTTGLAISWILFALGNNPEVQEKVHEEISEIFGNDSSNGAISQSKLQRLKYLDRVIKEGLRMYPSVPMIVRFLAEDVIFDNVKIPKGVGVSIFIRELHYDPDLWDDPEKFDPDRFLPENSRGRHPYAYIPFSAGPRNCIGQKFALLELKIVLAAVLRKWKVKSVLKADEAKYVAHVTLKPFANTVDLYFLPK